MGIKIKPGTDIKELQHKKYLILIYFETSSQR